MSPHTYIRPPVSHSFAKRKPVPLALLALIVMVLGAVTQARADEDPDIQGRGLAGEAGNAGQPDAAGAMTYDVPFKLPAGRGDAQPALGLRYRSDSGTGEAGQDWSLALPAIERTPLSGWPKYQDDGVLDHEDRYTYGGVPIVYICTSGECPSSEALGPLPEWASGYRVYRFQVEGAFTRFFLSPDRRTWIAQERGGRILEFGKPITRPDLTVPALEMEADTFPYRWLLSRVHDLHALGGAPVNLAVYRWISLDDGRSYLHDIFYTPPASNPTTASLEQFAYRVTLRWNQLAGAFDPTTVRHIERRPLRHFLSSVAVTAQPATPARRRLVRAYELGYYPARTYPPQPGQAPVWGRTFLQSITLLGRGETEVEEDAQGQLPTSFPSSPRQQPIVFSYSEAQVRTGQLAFSGGVFDVPWTPADENTDHRPPLLGVPQVAVMDVNRDGRPDIVGGWHQNAYVTWGGNGEKYSEVNTLCPPFGSPSGGVNRPGISRDRIT